MSGETCFDFDYNLTDILSKADDYSSISSGKETFSNGYLDSFDITFSVDELTSDEKNSPLDDDLHAFLDSHESKNLESPELISLAALAENHFSSNPSWSSVNKSENNRQDPFLSSFKDDTYKIDSLQDILFEETCDNGKNASNLEDFLSTLNLENSLINISNENKRSNEIEFKETYDDETIPDINLCFCIKKNSDEDEFSPASSSLESGDSGFSESPFSPIKTLSSLSDESSTNEIPFECNQVKSKMTRAKPSLFAKSISARPKIAESQMERLSVIKKNLLKKYVPLSFTEYKQKQKLPKLEIIDQSDQCVLTSSFLTVSKYI